MAQFCLRILESGLLKCSAIRETALECRKLLAQDTVTEVSNCPIDIGGVLVELSQISDSTDVEAISMALLEHDCNAVEELARLLRTPGRITMHQFLETILPALHNACLGRTVENSSMKGGHRSKKAKVGMFFGDDDDVQSFSPARRSLFCKELVNLLILEHGEKESKLENPSAAQESGPEAHEDDGEGEGESELMTANNAERPSLSGREISLYAESSELLRRLQQVLTLHERVSAVGLPSRRKASNGTDLQVLTAPLELELLPSSFSEPVPCARNQLILKAEPLLHLSEVELHVLRGCVPLDPGYQLFCQR